MKYLVLGLIATSLVTLTACNDKKEAAPTVADTPMETIPEKPAEAVDFTELLGHYDHMTFALSSDNAEETAKAATGMLAALQKIEGAHFDAEQKDTYQDIAANIKENAEHIEDNIGDIAHQREHLVEISTDIYDLVQLFGISKPYYKVFCPMVKGGEGAFWLSTTKDFRNPYMGEKMLSCGSIQEELN